MQAWYTLRPLRRRRACRARAECAQRSCRRDLAYRHAQPRHADLPLHVNLVVDQAIGQVALHPGRGEHARTKHGKVLALVVPDRASHQTRMALAVQSTADCLAGRVVTGRTERGIRGESGAQVNQCRLTAHQIHLALDAHAVPNQTRISEQAVRPVVGCLVDRCLRRETAVPNAKRSIREAASAPVWLRERVADGGGDLVFRAICRG